MNEVEWFRRFPTGGTVFVRPESEGSDMAQDEGRSAPDLLAQDSGPGKAQHPANEFCFFCVPDEIALSFVTSHDLRRVYEGPTVHWQVPDSFCPHFEEGDES